MKTTFYFFLAILLSLAIAAGCLQDRQGNSGCTAKQQISQEHNPEVKPRIVNGEQTTDFKMVGKIIVQNPATQRSKSGTGTMISRRLKLTAAHVVFGADPSTVTCKVDGRDYSVRAIYVHPLYDPNNFSNGYDLAIIELSESVNVSPMELLTIAPMVGEELTLVGYGMGGTTISGFDPTDVGRQVGTTKLEELTFQHLRWRIDDHSEANTAPGDSGGPAIVYRKGKGFIAGVTSGGRGAHQLGGTSFNVRVDANIQWIQAVMNFQ